MIKLKMFQLEKIQLNNIYLYKHHKTRSTLSFWLSFPRRRTRLKAKSLIIFYEHWLYWWTDLVLFLFSIGWQGITNERSVGPNSISEVSKHLKHLMDELCTYMRSLQHQKATSSFLQRLIPDRWDGPIDLVSIDRN